MKNSNSSPTPSPPSSPTPKPFATTRMIVLSSAPPTTIPTRPAVTPVTPPPLTTAGRRSPSPTRGVVTVSDILPAHPPGGVVLQHVRPHPWFWYWGYHTVWNWTNMELIGLIQRMNLDAQLSATGISFTVEQEYVNSTGHNIEMTFDMGLGPRMAVVGFEATKDGVTTVAEIKKKSEARDNYDDAISMGHTGLLGEVDKDSFKIIVGNLDVKQSVLVKVHVVASLEGDGESLAFVFPRGFFPVHSCALNFTVSAAEFPGGISSLKIRHGNQTHEMEWPKQWSSSNRLPPDAGISVHLTPKKAIEPSIALEDDGKSLAAAVTFYPTWPKLDRDLVTPYIEAVFLVDRSGSMGGGFGARKGQRLIKARETLQLFLSSLPPNCRFQIVGFGSNFQLAFPQGSVPYTANTLQSGKMYAARMEADMGGTDILSPLKSILSKPQNPEYPRHVFILTDGKVDNRIETVKFVQRFALGSRVHICGIGNESDAELIDGISLAGRGAGDKIADTSDLRGVVIRQLSKALEPTLRNVKLEWSCAVADVSPVQLPPIISGDRLIINVLDVADRTGSVKLTGVAPDDSPFSCEIPFSEPAKGKTLHQLAAAARIEELERNVELKVDENKAKTRIEALGLQYNIPSSRTSFFMSFANEKLASEAMWAVQELSHTSSSSSSVSTLAAGSLQFLAKKPVGRGGFAGPAHPPLPPMAAGGPPPPPLGGMPPPSPGGGGGMPPASPMRPPSPGKAKPAAHFDSADWKVDKEKERRQSRSPSPTGLFRRKNSRSSSPVREEAEAEAVQDFYSADEVAGGAGGSGGITSPSTRNSSIVAPRMSKSSGVPSSSIDSDRPPSPTSSGRPASPTSGESATSDVIQQAANLQDPVGSWSLAAASRITKHPEKAISSAAPKCGLADANLLTLLWATALVVAHLTAKHSDSEDVWRLLAQKARTFIKKTLLANKVDFDLLAAATTFIQGK